MFLLDTTVVSELRKAKSGRASTAVVEWAAKVPRALMFISVITLHELERGVLLAERSDQAAGAVLRRWLEDDVTAAFADRVLPVDLPVSRAAASFHVPDPAPFSDAFIGATALVHGLTMVSRNVSDFERFAGLDVLNPWS